MFTTATERKSLAEYRRRVVAPGTLYKLRSITTGDLIATGSAIGIAVALDGLQDNGLYPADYVVHTPSGATVNGRMFAI
jgi:hypothetical protein